MLKPALQLKLGQQLTMTPQLQQAIKLLQLPVLELQAQVMEALETNVMLEQEEDDTIDLTSLDQVAPTGEAEAESFEGGEGSSEATETDEPTADDVIVEMEDPWAESSTPSGDGSRADETTTVHSSSPTNAAATCISTSSGSSKSARSIRARCGSAKRSSTR